MLKKSRQPLATLSFVWMQTCVYERNARRTDFLARTAIDG